MARGDGEQRPHVRRYFARAYDSSSTHFKPEKSWVCVVREMDAICLSSARGRGRGLLERSTDLDSEERFVKYMITHPPTDANFGHAKTAAGASGQRFALALSFSAPAPS